MNVPNSYFFLNIFKNRLKWIKNPNLHDSPISLYDGSLNWQIEMRNCRKFQSIGGGNNGDDMLIVTMTMTSQAGAVHILVCPWKSMESLVRYFLFFKISVLFIVI